MIQWKSTLHERPDHFGRLELYLFGSVHVPKTLAGRAEPVFVEEDFILEAVRRPVDRYGLQPATLTFISIDEARAFLQPLVDQAARYGIVASGQAGENKAQKEHLSDLQRLLFDRLLPAPKVQP